MNLYQDEEAQYLATQVNNQLKIKLSQKGFLEWGKFALLFIIGLIIVTFSLPFLTFLLINPKPFTLQFSLGSFVILLSLFQLIPPQTLMQKSKSLIALIIYFVSLALGVYAGLFQLGYLKTLTVMSIQFITLIYLIVSQFPGGREGMHSCSSSLYRKLRSILPFSQ